MINLKSKSPKLTEADVILIKSYIFENDIRIYDENGNLRYLSSKEFIKNISNKPIDNKTKSYIKACKKLKKYDLRDVDNNLRQLKLI